jgi:hypothetical protein
VKGPCTRTLTSLLAWTVSFQKHKLSHGEVLEAKQERCKTSTFVFQVEFEGFSFEELSVFDVDVLLDCYFVTALQ